MTDETKRARDPYPGQTSESYIRALLESAKKHGSAVVGTFNGTEIEAYPDSTERELFWQWTALRRPSR